MFELPSLPYAIDALQPHLSKEALEYHYGKHHQTYVNNLNQLVQNTALENASLETIILQAEGSVFNNAAQHWNHSFYWQCLSPQSSTEPTGSLAQKLSNAFGSVANLKARFNEAAMALFGSGWTWLQKNPQGELTIVNASNAQLPMKNGQKALLVCDVWEHAYYIDYRNMRANYLSHFWQLVNWEFIAANLAETA